MPDLLVTLCTYNERDNLPDLVEEILSVVPQAHILVVDDSSPDGTGDLANQLASTDPRVAVLHRPGKQGLGAATIDAFRYGIEQGYEWLLNLDADFSHSPVAIPTLLRACSEADVIIGSRYIAGGAISGWPVRRHVLSRGVNFLARTLLSLPTRDSSGAFRCYRLSLLEQVNFSHLVAKGYAFQEEILYRCQQAGGRLKEVPIHFVERRAGLSKVNFLEIGRAFCDLTVLGCANWSGKAVTRR